MFKGKKAQTIAVVGVILALIVIGLLIYIALKPTTTGEIIKEKETIIKESITCNSPYIKVGNSCCLDKNSNSICDNEEISPLSLPSGNCIVNAPLGCDEFSISNYGINLVLRNGAGNDLRIMDVDISGCGRSYFNKIINEDSSEIFYIPCSLISETLFKGDITIKYIKLDGDIEQTTTGDITGKIERK